MNTIIIPDILLPKDADMNKWAVNACDQFTSDYGYWKEVESLVANSASTFNLIFPEIYLKDNPEKRIEKINRTMYTYLDGGVFKEIKNGFILVERTTHTGTRKGIVLAIDLEDYSFTAGEKSAVRSTEDTILERIPPRVQIRKNAPIELPHVMLLYNDKRQSVLNCVERGEVLYDFNLNMDGGHIRGSYIKNAEEVRKAFYALAKGNSFLFAVGDGNHSLATAKACWEEIKKTDKNSPARYALCEAVNIFDEALLFEPIHRFVKTDKTKEFTEGLKSLKQCSGEKAYIVVNGEKTPFNFDCDIASGIRKLDKYIAEFIRTFGGEVDYIHGESELVSLTSDGAGILLPSIKKDSFFNLIGQGATLPKKTFSMGEGNEKRYYIEAKRIK